MDKKTERRSISSGIATRKIVLIAALTVALLGLPGLLVDARAQFVIDHFKVYGTGSLIVSGVQTNVTLTDQFGTINVPGFVPIDTLALFATPAVKDGTFPDDLFDPGAHQFWWDLVGFGLSGTVIGLTVVNQFGTQEIIIQDPKYLVNPAHKTSPATAAPSELNHFLCYEVIISTTLSTNVDLFDQFYAVVAVPTLARFFCNPVAKSVSVCSEPAASVGDFCPFNSQCDDPPSSGNGVCGGTVVFPILHPDDHLTCYDISPGDPENPTVSATDLNFGPVVPVPFTLPTEELLCVPSTKTVLVNDPPIPALPARGVIAFLLLVTGAALVVWRRRTRRMSA